MTLLMLAGIANAISLLLRVCFFLGHVEASGAPDVSLPALAFVD